MVVLSGYSILALGDSGPGEPIALTGQRRYPAFSAGHLGERPTLRGYLHRQIAILDRKARPRRLDQCVLCDLAPRAINQQAEQRHRTVAQRDRLGALKKGLALCIEAKRTELINCGDRPVSNS